MILMIILIHLIFILYLFQLIDEMGLIYVLICASAYPQRCAHMCLEELQRTVIIM